MTDKRSEIEAIVAALEREDLEQEGLEQEASNKTNAKGPEGFTAIAQTVAQYYDALVEEGLEKEAALTLVFQWHMMMWAQVFSAKGGTK